MTLALWPSLRRLGFRWHLRFDWNHPAVRRLGKLALWVVVYVVANQLGVRRDHRVHRQVHRRLPDLRERVHPVPAARTRSSRCRSSRRSSRRCRADGRPATSTDCARSSRAGSATRSWSSCRRRSATSRSPCRSSASCSQHGRRRRADAEDIAHTLQAFAVGLPFFSAFQLLTRTFYAMQDTRTPAIVNVGAAVVNMGANLLFLSFGWGLWCLALGHATSYVFATVREPDRIAEAPRRDRRHSDLVDDPPRDPRVRAGWGRGLPHRARGPACVRTRRWEPQPPGGGVGRGSGGLACVRGIDAYREDRRSR